VNDIWGSRLETLQHTTAGVTAACISNGEIIRLNPEKDFVCFAIGMKPDIELFAKTGLSTTRDVIVVDTEMRTTIPNV
jgi:thioredoxin reductase